MPVDAGIYGQFAPRVQSVSEIQNGLAQQQANALAAQHSGLQLQQMQTDMADNNALRAAYRGGADPSTPKGRAELIQAAPLQAPAIFKSQADLAKTQADTKLSTAHAADYASQDQLRQIQKVRDGAATLAQQLTTVNTPQDTVGWYQQGIKQGLISPEDAMAEINKVPTDPQGFAQWKQQQQQKGMSVVEQSTQAFKQLQLKSEETRADAALKNQVLMTGMNNATSRANNASTQAGENARSAASRAIETVKADPYGDLGLNKNVPQSVTTGAGLTGDAYLQTLSPAVQNQVKMMADGKIPITAMALRSPQVMALLRMASQYDPGTDATTYQSRAKTAQDFSSGGKSGQQLTNANLALHHAGQLGDAIDKLNNSDFLPGITNPISNLAAQKLGGDTSQGVYKQKADALSSELRKLYAGSGGGSLKELESWQSTFDENASKTQQKAYLKSGMELLTGAIQSKQEAYDRGMGGRGDFAKMLSPESLKVLQRLAPDYAATLGGAKSAPAAPSSSGFKYIGPVK